MIIQKIFEKDKIAGKILFLSWLAKYQWKKIIEHYNSVGAGAHKVRKVVSLWPNIDPNFPDIMKRINYIYWDRLVLVHLRRYYKNVYIIAL